MAPFTAVMRDALYIRNVTTTNGAAYTPFKVMPAALKFHFPEAYGISVSTKWLGPGTAVKVDVTESQPARFVPDTSPAGLNSLAAHPVTIVRRISSFGAAIAIGSRTIIMPAMPDLDEEGGIVTNTGGNSRPDRRTVHSSGECDESRRSKGNGGRSRSHDVFHHANQKTCRTGTVPEMSVHIPLPDELGGAHSFRHKNDYIGHNSRFRRTKWRAIRVQLLFFEPFRYLR